MSKEYRAKVFKSGNSVALRLPKALGLKAGQEMIVREERTGFAAEPATPGRTIDLGEIWGSCPGIAPVGRIDFEPRQVDEQSSAAHG